MSEFKLKIISYLSKLARSGVAPCIRLLEKVCFKSDKRAKAPIFIVGAPRTGSTILYQALTNAYNVAYIDNNACAWHRNLRFGMWLSSKKCGDAPHNNFVAEHGNTQKFGGHAPSECGGFWYRWLPRDRHFVDYSDITEKMVKQIQTEVYGVSALLGKPLLFKNLNMGQRLRLIKRAFPEAKIIFVRRDPRFVVQSILKARARVGVKSGEWWSIMPPNRSTLLSLPEPEMCAAQVYYLEKQIEEDLALFPEGNIKKILCQDLSEKLVHKLGRWVGLKPRPDAKMPEFRIDALTSIEENEREELSRIVQKYPFSKDAFI